MKISYENRLKEVPKKDGEQKRFVLFSCLILFDSCEAARLQNAASNLQPSTLNSMMNGVQNWDQLMNRFEIEAPESNPDVQRDQTFYCDLAKEFWGVEHSVSLQVCPTCLCSDLLIFPRFSSQHIGT